MNVRRVVWRLIRGTRTSRPSDPPPGYVPTAEIFPVWERVVRALWLLGPLAVAGGALLVWWQTGRAHRVRASFPPAAALLEETGLHTAPAVSADGETLVVASNRGGSPRLYLWIRQNGTWRRVTTGEPEETDPDLSPDGNHVVFRSEAEGGGIYLAQVSAAQGPSAPQRLAPGGWRPRFSPGGERIAFLEIEGEDSTYGYGRVFVMNRDGSGLRRIAADFEYARHPVWIDSKRMLLEGTSGTGASDWWVVDIHGGAPPVRTGAFRALAESLQTRGSPERWHRGQVIFSARNAGLAHLWALPLSPETWQAGLPLQVTDGPEDESRAAVSDSRLYFVRSRRVAEVYQAALDPERGVLTGNLAPVSNDQAHVSVPTVSAGGERLVYLSDRTGAWDLWARDDGEPERLTVFRNVGYRPVLSEDGRRVALPLAEAGSCAIDISDLSAPGRSEIIEGCYQLWDWCSRTGKLLVFDPRQRIKRVELLESHGRTHTVLRHPKHGVYAARFSPDGRRIAFLTGLTSGDAPVYLAPFTGQEVPPEKWIAIPESSGGVPAWSPGGRVLYFRSLRDGYPCLWAQPLDPGSGRPTGAPAPVLHFHETAFGMALLGWQDLNVAVSRTHLVLNLARDSSTVWTAAFPD